MRQRRQFTQHRSIQHKTIERAKLLCYQVRHFTVIINSRPFEIYREQHRRRMTGETDFVGEIFQSLHITSTGNNCRARHGAANRDCPADPLTGTGDQNASPMQFIVALINHRAQFWLDVQLKSPARKMLSRRWLISSGLG